MYYDSDGEMNDPPDKIKETQEKDVISMGLFRPSTQPNSDLNDYHSLPESISLDEDTASDMTPVSTPRSAGSKETVLGQGQFFEGTISGEGAVRLEGTFKGDINLQGAVSISVTGVFVGTIEATNVFIFGSVDGNIKAHGKVRLACGCKVKGDVIAESLSIEDGATFNGYSTMMTDTSDPSALPPTQKKSEKKDDPQTR